ncbi:DNA translocase FtsK [Patescibacteria group bacterium]|nr:DNA translocase FtsK [Patescibacteria group bacterium]
MARSVSSKKKKIKKTTNPKNQSKSQNWIVAIVLITLAIVLFLGLLDSAGLVGNFLGQSLTLLFGWASWILPIFFLLFAYLFLNYFKIQEKGRSFNVRLISLIFCFLICSAIFHLFVLTDADALTNHRGGGYVGYALTYFLVNSFGFWAASLIFVCIFLVTLIISLEGIFSFKKKESKKEEEIEEEGSEQELPLKKTRRSRSSKIGKKIAGSWKKVSQKIDQADSELEQELSIPEKELSSDSKKDDQSGIKIPSPRKFSKVDLPLNLLEGDSTRAQGGDTKANALIIEKTLKNFSIPVEMRDVKVGPTVTQYTLKPVQGVKLSQITSLGNDLALALAAHPIRIEAPIPGQSLVGIEVPNQKTAIIRLREILSSKAFKQRSNNLTLGLGRDVAGDIRLADLGRMPHLLVAGSTGSGKTIFLNTIILSLLYQNSINDLKFIFVDPKRVELTLYEGLPHLLTPVITDVTKTVNALKWAVGEMDRRFDVMAEAKKRDIGSYNKAHPDEKMPYIVIVIDELADLMAVAAQDVEACIIRLAQMARATGIHLVMATQRPSVNVITGLIKANITARVSFSVVSSADSRTILDFSGAEKLLGRGDMLFTYAELSKPKRLQGAYVSDQEIKKIVNYLKEVAEPEYEEGVVESQSRSIVDSHFGGDMEEEDELMPQAREMIIRAGKASASFLQRRLRIGYARAARILDYLEEEGTIGPSQGSKAREVFKKPYEEDGEAEERTYDNDL